ARVTIFDPIIHRIRYMIDPINFWGPGYPASTTTTDEENEDTSTEALAPNRLV
ncbi:unnamed protein product, partial [Rotaria sordida]